MLIENVLVGGSVFLADADCLSRGVKHGFSMKPFDSLRPEDRELLSRSQSSPLCLLKQVHGTAIIDLRDASGLHSSPEDRPEADGMILPLSSPLPAPGTFAIQTADCLPVIMLSSDSIALLHAGWRGLASGILQAALAQIGGGDIEVLLGPAAGGCCYEVGPEVADRFSHLGVVRAEERSASRIDLAEAAEKILVEHCGSRVKVIRSGLCTICDRRFHSWRREGKSSGRNLCFVSL